jgi:serine/alanine adding enzyme
MRLSEQPDIRRWDAHLRTAGGHPLQASAWGRLKEHFGWQAQRLWVDDGRAAAQLLIRPYRGVAAAYVPRGPLLSGDEMTDGALLDGLIRRARSRRAAFLRLEPDVLEGAPSEATLRALLADRGFRPVERTLQPRSSIHLDIARTDDELRGGLSKGHRADVRRAERGGVQVRVGTAQEDVDRLHEMMRATQQRKSFGVHTPAYYRALWQLFADDARLLLAEQDGEALAATLVLAFGDKALYLAAGSTRRGLEMRASHALQWQAIRWARERGARTYDLWGIPDARGRAELHATGSAQLSEQQLDALRQQAGADPLDGVFRFKKGWGGSVVRSVPAFDRVFFAPAYWFWRWRRSEA